MRSFVLLSLLLAPAAAFADPGEFASRSDAIINGQACASATLPATVALLSDGEVTVFGQKQTIKTVSCTGTLIAPDVVLAAAHCVDMSMQTMGFGTVDREAYAVTFEADLVALSEQTSTTFPPDTVYASSWVPHPQFSMDAMGNVSGPGDYYDIALLFLERPITHVQPEIVITAEEAVQLQVGSTLEIAGWGMTTSEKQTFPPTPPPKGTVGRKVCATSFVGELGATEMLVGGDVNSSRKCHGDSGGPSYLTIETDHDVKRRVVGVTSHAYDERDCDFGGVDTRVDAYLSWIDTELIKGCTDGVRAWCDVPGLIPAEYYNGVPDAPTGPIDDGRGGDLPDDGCGCTGTSSGLLALAAVLLARRRRFA